MTALAAVLRHDGGVCAPGTVQEMLTAASRPGARRAVLVDGPAGLGQVGADEPAKTGGGQGLRIIFSGALHNRPQLDKLLDHLGVDASDGEAVLEAYAAWGESCAERLLGEFAFVLWDPGRRRLVAARDATGTRTLFYAHCPGVWLVASECGQLAAHPAHVPEPDEDSLSRLLELDFADARATFWRGVYRLPAAHVLVVDERGHRLRRYWRPDPDAQLGCTEERELAEHFRSVFAEAVRCRLRGPEPVGCLFSGGVDSSAVLCVAHHVRDADTPPIHAYSMVFPAAPVDDRPFIDAVRELHGATVHFVRPPVLAPVRGLDAVLRRTRSPFVDAHHHLVDELFTACEEGGCRTVLTGLRGDDIFGGLAHFADRVARLRFRGLRAELDAWSPILGAPSARLFWTLCVSPWLDSARPIKQAMVPGRLVRRRSWERRWPGFPTRALEEAHRLALGPFTLLTTELFELNAVSHGLIPAYPFWDRRVVELALALPPPMRASLGVTKRILRDAMVGIMPERNRQRVDKLSLTGFFRRGLVQEDRDLVQDALSRLDPRLAGLVRPDRLQRAIDDLEAGREVPLLQIWFLICANLWLRHLAAGAGRDGAAAQKAAVSSLRA